MPDMNIQKVLLIDDDPNIRKLAKMSLERVGRWQVSVASSGQEALEIVETERPDLIVLDMMMPGLDGAMTLEKLKSRPSCASVPVILMTAKVQPPQMDEYREMGAAGLIIKPFDPLKLPEEILKLLK
jgi:two-component system OmpR family response regulator